MRLPPTQILSGNDGTAGGQSGERIHQQDIHRIHQGNCGHSRLSHLCHHQGIRQAHGDGQQLFHYQRDHQFAQIPGGKFHG